MIRRNVRLKSLIFATGLTQNDFARASGVNRTYLSLAINGRYILSEAEKGRIAQVLGKRVEEVFDEK